MNKAVVPRPQIGDILTPVQAMRLAIQEGSRGTGFVSPNPLVGCTILDREHRFLAVGFHRRVGFDHAEIDALKQVPDESALEGAHVFVTLEPCAHQGRTPSCARTLAPRKLGSLTYAVEDPNPLVAGQGARILREAGVKTWLLGDRLDIPEAEREALKEEAEDLAEIFLHNMRAKEPFIAVKVATSLDGKMALTSGESKWITGEAAREHVHFLRAHYDAVSVGRNTFVADDPSLNVRHGDFPGFTNKAIVFDPKGKTLSAMASSNLIKVRDPKTVFVVLEEGVRVENPAGVSLLPVPLNETGAFAMGELLQALKASGIYSVMIEGGAHTFSSFFVSEKVQRLHLFQAPSLLGGRHGVSWSAHFGVDQMAHRIRIQRSERREFGEDLYWTGRVRFAAQPVQLDPHK